MTQKERDRLLKMRRKTVLYHVTEPKNTESIMRFGLRREGWCVYLSTKPLSWYRDGLRILRVDISGLTQVKANTFLPDSDEVLWWGEVPSVKKTKDGEWVSRITDVTERYIDRKGKADE